MTDDPINPERVQTLADRPVDLMVWQRMFALFQDELAHAAAKALARGTPADRLAEQIEERIARLRRQIGTAGQEEAGEHRQ